MGLDIYLYEINSRGSSTFTLHNADDNRSRLGLFEKFNEFTTVIDTEYYNFIEVFNSKNLNAKEYRWVRQDENGYHFEHNDAKNIIIFDYDTLDRFIHVEKEKCIYAEEVAYQRKGVTTDFYDKFYGNCWYVFNKSNVEVGQENIFIYNNEILKIAQQYCEDGYPFKSWKLKSNQFVYFNA